MILVDIRRKIITLSTHEQGLATAAHILLGDGAGVRRRHRAEVN